MVSYNRVSLARKKELEQQDRVSATLSRMFEFIIRQKVKLISGLTIVFLAIAIVTGVYYFRNRSEALAFNELNKCETKYNEQIKTNSPQEVYEAVHTDYQRIRKDHQGTVAAKMSTIRLADICYNAERFDDAVSLYQSALPDFSDDPFLKSIILNGLAYSYEAVNNTPEAIKYFEMVASDDTSAMKDGALYNLGRIYSENGDTQKSMEFCKRLFEEHPDSMYNKFAEEKLASG
jgi:tetratricopeptide (TPR) repeat protein